MPRYTIYNAGYLRKMSLCLHILPTRMTFASGAFAGTLQRRRLKRSTISARALAANTFTVAIARAAPRVSVTRHAARGKTHLPDAAL